MQLLPTRYYETIFAPLCGKVVGYVQGMHGNAGDALIHYGTLNLFAQFGIHYDILNSRIDWNGKINSRIEHVVLFGGGSMGYPLSGRLRTLVRKWPGPITLLPQSWRDTEEAPYDRVFTRERYSLGHCPRARLAPDLALAFDYQEDPPMPAADLGICLRQDRESRFGGVGEDPAAGLGRLDAAAYLRRAARFKIIITDRLHFAICGLFNRRRVILLPNCYDKNRGVYEAWLSRLGCEWADNPDMALRML